MLLRAFIAALMAGLFSVSDASAIDPLDEANKAFEAARAALVLSDFQQAELYLERTLMYQPEHAEARVELALLLASRGRVEAALLFIESLILDHRTPADYRDRLLALGRAIQSGSTHSASPKTSTPKSWRGQMNVAMGFQHNPLAGTAASSLLLTLPAGAFELPIEDQVESAAVLRLAAQASHDSGLYFEAQSQSVLGGVKRNAGRLLLSNNIKDVAQGVVSLGFTTEKTPFGEQSRAVFAAWTGAKTRLSTQFYTSPSQGRQGLTLRWDEAFFGGGIGPLKSSVSGFAEHEWSLREGPDQTRFGIRSFLKYPTKTNVWAHLTAHRDQTGYSAFLEDRSRREMVTAHVQVEHSIARFEGGQDLILQAHFTRRWSGLSLFTFRDAGAFLLFRHVW